MEYGTDEYWKAIRKLVDVVVEEGKDGPFTEKGLKEDGSDVFFRIVQALEPFGICLRISIKSIEEDSPWDAEEFTVDEDEQDNDGDTE